jgi:hypothetical protein
MNAGAIGMETATDETATGRRMHCYDGEQTEQEQDRNDAGERPAKVHRLEERLVIQN